MDANFRWFVLAGAAFALSYATPVSASATRGHGQCRVSDASRLHHGQRGADAICFEIQSAIGALAPTANYRAQVRVLTPTRLSATLVVNGRTLPEQNFAVMDHDLDLGSIRRFAAAIAAAVAKAAQ